MQLSTFATVSALNRLRQCVDVRIASELPFVENLLTIPAMDFESWRAARAAQRIGGCLHQERTQLRLASLYLGNW
jgi:hypothetical protein